VAQTGVGVPQQPALAPGRPHRLDHVHLAVRPREHDHADHGAHAPSVGVSAAGSGARAGDRAAGSSQLVPVIVTVASSMTGLVRKRAPMSSTSDRADASSPASMVKRNALPTVTPDTPSNPRAGSDRSIVAPWGSATPGRSWVSTSTENCMG